MTAACNFISLGEKIGELLEKKREKKEKKRRKEKRKITDHLIGQKRRIVSQCFLVKLNES